MRDIQTMHPLLAARILQLIEGVNYDELDPITNLQRRMILEALFERADLLETFANLAATD